MKRILAYFLAVCFYVFKSMEHLMITVHAPVTAEEVSFGKSIEVTG
jgi:hypothetical protein